MKLKQFLKQETVLSVAAILSVLSMFFVPPDAEYFKWFTLSNLIFLVILLAEWWIIGQ